MRTVLLLTLIRFVLAVFAQYNPELFGSVKEITHKCVKL